MLLCVGVGDDDVLDEEYCLPQLALVLENLHYLLALGELDVLVELVELDDARELDIFVLELHHEALLVAHGLDGCAGLRLGLNIRGHIAPQVLELRIVIVLDIEPRRLVRLDVVVLALPLRDVDVAFLKLVQKDLGIDDDDVLARRIALVDDCRVEDCGSLDGLGARLVEECLMSGYLSRRWCRPSVDSSGSVLSRTKW